MTISNINLYAISVLVTAILLLIVLPVLTVAILMLLSDSSINTIYLDNNYGGDNV